MKLLPLLLMLFLAININAQDELPVTWKVNVKKINQNTACIKLKATMKDGWVLYGVNTKDNSPISTKITIDGADAVGQVTTSPKPVKEFDKIMDQEMIKHKVPTIFKQQVKFLNDNATVSVTYMACNNKSCLPPTTEEFTVDFK